MERFLSKIGAWVQMLIAAFVLAVAGFNCWRVITGQYTVTHVVMFIALVGVCIALLVFSVRDYEKLLKNDDELEHIK